MTAVDNGSSGEAVLKGPPMGRRDDEIVYDEGGDEKFQRYQGEVFCNRALNMRRVMAVGFDMDYTLAQYNPQSFELLAHRGAMDKLVNFMGYPEVYTHYPPRVRARTHTSTHTRACMHAHTHSLSHTQPHTHTHIDRIYHSASAHSHIIRTYMCCSVLQCVQVCFCVCVCMGVCVCVSMCVCVSSSAACRIAPWCLCVCVCAHSTPL